MPSNPAISDLKGYLVRVEVLVNGEDPMIDIATESLLIWSFEAPPLFSSLINQAVIRLRGEPDRMIYAHVHCYNTLSSSHPRT